MHAFIIRPSGVRSGIDFDRVERELIDPALRQVRVDGRTTGEIAPVGILREDMLELLTSADLVIADVSIPSPGIFYALGIRHALADRHTVLIRCAGDDLPSSLLAARLLEYARERPGAVTAELVRALSATLSDERPTGRVMDLPNLPAAQDQLLVVPSEFREELRRAHAGGRAGDLALLADEASRFRWALEGLRAVGTAQVDSAAFAAARSTWEHVRALDPEDLEANRRLATIYHKLGDPTRSDQAVERVLESRSVRGADRAELLSLRGANARKRWVLDWRTLPEPQRRAAALRSPWLEEARAAYGTAFEAGGSHYRSGLDALALLTVRLELADELPEVWRDAYETEELAAADLERLREERTRLAETLELALQAARRTLDFEHTFDRWLEIAVAELACLTGANPARVAAEYRLALKDAAPFFARATRGRLAVYRDLGVLQTNVQAALRAVDDQHGSVDFRRPTRRNRVVLFSGHRLDSPERALPRFPRNAEHIARAMIQEAIESEQRTGGGELLGIAGGASGGDILFHEVCEELGIPTALFLAAPRDTYVAHSVQEAGPEWVARFDRLLQRLPIRTLSGSLELPHWLRTLEDYSVWQRSNRWMLHNALAHADGRVVVIALRDGGEEAEPGGTRDMIEESARFGVRTVTLDAARLLQVVPHHSGNGPHRSPAET